MKYIKQIRYIKFATAIILFALLFGMIWYEYGYERGLAVGYGHYYSRNGFVQSVESFYVWAAFVLIYLIVCLCQGWGETSLGTNIFSTAFIGVPFIAMLVVWIAFADADLVRVCDVLSLVAFGVTFVLEAVILILHIRQDIIISKKFKKSVPQ